MHCNVSQAPVACGVSAAKPIRRAHSAGGGECISAQSTQLVSEWPWHWQSQRRQIRVGSDWPLESVVLDNGQGRPQDTTYNNAAVRCMERGHSMLYIAWCRFCAGVYWAHRSCQQAIACLLCFALLCFAAGTVGRTLSSRSGRRTSRMAARSTQPCSCRGAHRTSRAVSAASAAQCRVSAQWSLTGRCTVVRLTRQSHHFCRTCPLCPPVGLPVVAP